MKIGDAPAERAQRQTAPEPRPVEIRSLIGMGGFVALLHLIGWGVLLLVIAPQHLRTGLGAFGAGIGVTAYVLGMRHAFDADHIAAIDNTTRKLVGEGKASHAVGFWFSLGHSTVVFLLAMALAAGLKVLAGPVVDAHSTLQLLAGLAGPTISSAFLFLIAGANTLTLITLWRSLRGHGGEGRERAANDEGVPTGGLIMRAFGKWLRPVRKPWHMYVVGLLFGLGFDTATEIALLILAGSGAVSGLPWYAVLCLPVLFAAGMSLLDSLDGSAMSLAYGWAFSRPVRRGYYNLVITGLSVAVAAFIGTIEASSVIARRLELKNAVWAWLSTLDLGGIGIATVALLVSVWAASALVHRLAK